MGDLAVYWALAFSAFTSASLLPGSSELVLATLSYKGYPLLLLWTVATLANTAGSLLNWWLGTQVQRFADKRWFPASPAQMAQAEHWHARYGRWSILLCWLPVVGDPLTVIAWVLRQPLSSFIPLVFIAKGARYALVLLAAEQFLPTGR